jgi:hypothetical protein
VAAIRSITVSKQGPTLSIPRFRQFFASRFVQHPECSKGRDIVTIEEVLTGQVLKSRRTSLRAGSVSQVFSRSRAAPEDKETGHKAEGSASVGHAFKTGVGRELPGGFDSRPPPPSGVGVALTLRGCKSPPPARTRSPAFVPFVRFGPGHNSDVWFRLTRDTSAPGDGLRGSLLAVSP